MISTSDAAPPATFKAYLSLYRFGLNRVAQSLFNELLRIALPNATILKSKPIEWAKCQIGLLLDEEELSVRSWIKRVCDKQDIGQVPETDEEFEERIFWRNWRAPRLIHMQPSGTTPFHTDSAWTRENESTTLRLLESISRLVLDPVRADLERTTGHAHVEIAKQPPRPVEARQENSQKPATMPVDNARVRPRAVGSLNYRSGLKRAILIQLTMRPSASDLIARIHRLKLLIVEVKAGRAIRKYKAVRSDAPADLVFQSVKDGKPMRDNNILRRFIKPAARKLGLPWIHWRSLRTSHAVLLKLAGADVKDAQGQTRTHKRP